MTQRLFAKQTVVKVGVADQVVIGADLKRFGLMFNLAGAPDTPYTTTGAIGHAVATAAAGVAQNFVVPAGQQGYLDSASAFQTAAGAVVLALQIVRGGVTITLQQFSPNGVWTSTIPLQAGDTVQWNVITPVAATASDLSINILLENIPNRVSLNLEGPSTLGQGIEVVAGNLPVRLPYGEFG